MVCWLTTGGTGTAPGGGGVVGADGEPRADAGGTSGAGMVRDAGEAAGVLGAGAAGAPEVGEDWMPGASWVEVVPAGAATRRE
jgi:hypothetical protein